MFTLSLSHRTISSKKARTFCFFPTVTPGLRTVPGIQTVSSTEGWKGGREKGKKVASVLDRAVEPRN